MKTKCDGMYARVCKMIEQDNGERPPGDEAKWKEGFDAMKPKIQKKLSQSALLGEAIANTSTEDTEIVVVSMPFPSPTISPFTFMAMLDLTSSPSNKPFFF